MGGGASTKKDKEENVKFQAADVERAITLSRSALAANQKKAITQLLQIATVSDDKLREKIVDLGGLESIINMLRSPSQSVQILAAKTVAKLANADRVRHRLAAEGAIPPLCESFRKTTDVKNKLIYSAALNNLAQLEDARPKIVAEGSTVPALSLLREDSLDIQLQALGLLARLSQHPKSHARMGRDGAIGPLLDVLSNPMKSVKHKRQAVSAIAELSDHYDNHRALAECEYKEETGAVKTMDGLAILTALLAHYVDEVKALAALAVARLAQNPLHRDPLSKKGCVENLIPMMKAPKLPLQKHSCAAICQLSQDPLNQVHIVKCGALPPLIRLSRCGNDAVEASASLAIAFLASNNINRPRMIRSGAFKPLVYNARFGHSKEIKDASLSVLACLFYTEQFRKRELTRKVCEKFKSLLIRKRQNKGIVGRHYKPPNDAMGQDDPEDGASQNSDDDDF